MQRELEKLIFGNLGETVHFGSGPVVTVKRGVTLTKSHTKAGLSPLC